jgi:acetoin utilization protein AcuC
VATVTIPWSPALQAYNPSSDTERALRRGLAWDLLQTMGLLDAPWARRVDPVAASDEEIARVHAPAYIRVVRRYSAAPMLSLGMDAGQWGFVPGMDTVATAGMHEAAALVCGAAMEGARAVWAEPGRRAFCPAPAGLHHAFANRASGFCVYNDCALAIRELLDLGAERVAYVDLDAHHGDGVQSIFYDDPRVLCVSVHEYAYGFFPGTGGLDERGSGPGEGATINVPLPPFAGDAAFLAAVDDVVVPAVSTFAPDALVVHLGADVHHADPLTHLQVTIPALERIYATIARLADDSCAGRLLAITGGGYNPTNLGRIWALQLGALAGVEVDDALPEGWRSAAHTTLGEEPPERLRTETAPEADPTARQAGDVAGLRNVAAAVALLA